MKKKNKDRDLEHLIDEDFFYETEEDEFEIGQSYKDIPAKKLRCKKCNGDKFRVGQAYCFTAIKCDNCLWELCIHDG